MSIEEAARYVAAAYAVILAVLIIYFIISTRRMSRLTRDVDLLEREVERRQGGGTPEA
jgi:heme exporter protein D